MDRSRIPPAFALVAVVACASRPTLPPESSSSPEPIASPATNSTPPPSAETLATAPPATPSIAPAQSSSPAAPHPDDSTTPAPLESDGERTPGITSGAVAVRGELHPTRVQAAMRTAFPAIRECHQRALEKRTVEDKPVRVQLNFEITEKGLITKLTDDTANLNPLFSSCVLRAVAAVTFPPPKRGIVSVTYPLELTKP